MGWFSDKWKQLNIYYIFVKLMIEIKMNNDTKQTVIGIIKALIKVAGIFAIDIPDATSQIIITAILAIWAVVDVIQGYFAKGVENKKKVE